MDKRGHGYHITDIREEDCAYLASLHLKYFGPSIISAFGEKFLLAAYEGMIGARWGRTILFQKGDETLGFATVVMDGGKFFFEILKRRGWAMAIEVLRASFRTPRILKNVVRAARYPASFSGETKAELLTLITREDCRGMGTGTILMEEVMRILREAGCPRFKVSVKKSWTRAVDFYLKRGFEVMGEIDDGKEGLLFLKYDFDRSK
ncbi:MAG: GNAT family N-acetyltransferase [Candidatus Glassbacteria bacterium]